MDKGTKTLIAYTDHFTVFDMDVNNWQSSHLPTVDSFQVSSFTGAATYSLPIEVPPGPGGFQPSLSLNYNSQVVDQSTLNAQASWVGMGWSLDTGSMELDGHGTNSSVDDTFFLNVGGVSTKVVRDPSGVYHAADENFWKISFDSSTNSWVVKDKQGNTYTFAHTSAFPEQLDNCMGYSTKNFRWSLTKVENIFGQQIVYDYVDDTRSVRIFFPGAENCYGQAVGGAVTATYLNLVTYSNGKYGIWFDKGSTPNRFDYTSWWNDPAPTTPFHAFEKYRLQNIYVMQDSNGDTILDTVVRRYELGYAANTDSDIIFPGYTWSAGGKTSTLISVRQYGVGGGGTPLPAKTFTYGDNLHLTRADNGYGGAVEFDYEPWYYAADARPSYSIQVNFGGYGGMPCFDGVADPWYARGGAGYVNCEADQGPSPLAITGAFGVPTVVATAGDIRNSTTSEYVNHSKDLVRPGGIYKLSASMSLGTGMSARVGLFNGSSDNFPVAGDPSNIIRLPASASKAEPLIEVSGLTSSYATVGNFSFQLLTSIYRVKEKRVKDGAGHTYPFTYSYLNGSGADSAGVNDAVNSATGICAPGSTDCHEYYERYSEFRGHGRVTETGPDGKKTITEFRQGDVLKGRPNWTEIKNGSLTLSTVLYSYTSVSLPVQSPAVAYCSLCAPYIGVTRNFVYTNAAESRVYEANGTSYSATKTLFTNETTYGNLTLEQDQTWNGSAWTTYQQRDHIYAPNDSPPVYLVSLPVADRVLDPAGNILASTLYYYDGNTGGPVTPPTAGKLTAIRTRINETGTQFSQVSYGYDIWGNRTSVTTYTGYSASNSTSPTTGAATTTTVFDSTYHTYPISQTTPGTPNAPSGLTTTWTYNYTLGIPLTETDPNGNPTSAQYDAFGRMIKLIRPGDDATNPTIRITYHDTIQPFQIDLEQRMEGANYQVIRKSYDGMGRLIHNRIWNAEVNGEHMLSVVNSAYDAYGRVVKQTVPFPLPFNTPYSADFAHPTTDTLYDVLGRPTQITAPNGNVVSYNYNGLVSTVTDAKGYNTTTTTDVWGRVVSVAPPTGPGVTYTYDLLNNLKTAARGGVTTEIKYDQASRKLGMDDPDMGMAGNIGDDNWAGTTNTTGLATSQNKPTRAAVY